MTFEDCKDRYSDNNTKFTIDEMLKAGFSFNFDFVSVGCGFRDAAKITKMPVEKLISLFNEVLEEARKSA